MPLWRWNRTAASNSNADPTINWSEGMAPSAVNDSARAEMAAVAQYRDDVAGIIVTGGTGTAYTVSSYSIYDTLAHLDGAVIAFTPHTPNGQAPTLNVDGLGGKPIRLSPAVDVQSNVLIAGTPYTVTYSNADAAWYLHGMASNAYGIPLGMGGDYWGTTAPSSAFAFPLGQPLSRTGIYAPLFNIMGTTHGAGDGSTTFNLPNKAERVSVMKANVSASLLSFANFGADSAVMGAKGGSDGVVLSIPQMPQHDHGVFLQDPGHSHTYDKGNNGGSGIWPGGGGFGVGVTPAATVAVGTGMTIGSSPGGGNLNKVQVAGSSTAHPNVQPTIVCNYIMRVI